MSKKIISISVLVIIILGIVTFIVGVQKVEYVYGTYEFMDTYIEVNYQTTRIKQKEIDREIEQIFYTYDQLSNNYKALSSDDYFENVYSINQKIGQKLEIDKPLYDLLVKAEYIKDLTDGYFDVSVGKSIDIWKSVIETELGDFSIGDSIYVYYFYDGEVSDDNRVIINDEGVIKSIEYDKNDSSIVLSLTLDINGESVVIDRDDRYQQEVSDLVFNNAMIKIEALDFSTNQMLLSENDGKYFVKTSGDDFKIDLGAIAKGYATQCVADYLKSKGVTYFYINSGTSSLYLGENSNPERDYYTIGLTCPICSLGGSYGTLSNIMNESVTTSGNYEQYVLHGGLRYHHIVSPKTKIPMQYYHSVTLISNDAGLLDALTTALFSMPEDVFDVWVAEHQNELNISIVRYNYNVEATDVVYMNMLGDITFEEE